MNFNPNVSNIRNSLFFLLVISGIFVSCKDDSKSNVKNFNIDAIALNELNLDNHAENIKFINLQDSSQYLIEDIFRYFFIKDEIILVIFSSNIEVHIFDNYGILLNQFTINNTGPGSINSMTDCWFHDNLLSILDFGTSTVYKYNLSGERVSKYDIPPNFTDGATINDKTMVFYADNSINEYGNYNLTLFDLGSNKIIDQVDPIKSYHAGIGLDRRPFFEIYNTLYYYPPIGLDIYEALANNLNKFISIKSKNLIPENSDNMSQSDFLSKRRNQEFISTFDAVYAHKNLILGQYRNKLKFYWVLINTHENKSYHILPKIDYVNEMKITYTPVGIDNEGSLYFIAYTYDIFSSLQNQKPTPLAQKFKKDLPDVKIEDDPILMKISIDDIYKWVNE